MGLSAVHRGVSHIVHFSTAEGEFDKSHVEHVQFPSVPAAGGGLMPTADQLKVWTGTGETVGAGGLFSGLEMNENLGRDDSALEIACSRANFSSEDGTIVEIAAKANVNTGKELVGRA